MQVNKYVVRDSRIKFDRIGPTVKVFNKGSSDPLQSIKIDVDSYAIMPNQYELCSNVSSYVTGKKMENARLDGDYGDFIVVDINFDRYDDFAIKVYMAKEFGAGTQYRFFIYIY